MCTYVGTYTIRGTDGLPFGILKLGSFWPSKIFRRIKQLLRPTFFLTLAILAAKVSPLERARDMEIEEICASPKNKGLPIFPYVSIL